MDGLIAAENGVADPASDSWEVAGRRFRSRLVVGTGRYKSLEETAAVLGKSVGSVKQLQRRGLLRLRELIGTDGGRAT